MTDSDRRTHCGPASDVYAMGAISYEVLAGRQVVEIEDGSKVFETMRQIREEIPRSESPR